MAALTDIDAVYVATLAGVRCKHHSLGYMAPSAVNFPTVVQNNIALSIEVLNAIHRTVIETMLLLAGRVAVSCHPYKVSAGELKRSLPVYAKARRLIERQRLIIDRDAFASLISFAVLLELNHKRIIHVIEIVSALRFG